MVRSDPPPDNVWRKSTFSLPEECVEVAFADRMVLVRDSKEPSGPVLRCSRAGWGAFIAGVRGGEFDYG